MGEEQPPEQLEKIVLQKNNIYILQSLTIYRLTGGITTFYIRVEIQKSFGGARIMTTYYTMVSKNIFFLYNISKFVKDDLSIDFKSIKEVLESLPFWMKPVIQECWKSR